MMTSRIIVMSERNRPSPQTGIQEGDEIEDQNENENVSVIDHNPHGNSERRSSNSSTGISVVYSSEIDSNVYGTDSDSDSDSGSRIGRNQTSVVRKILSALSCIVPNNNIYIRNRWSDVAKIQTKRKIMKYLIIKEMKKTFVYVGGTEIMKDRNLPIKEKGIFASDDASHGSNNTTRDEESTIADHINSPDSSSHSPTSITTETSDSTNSRAFASISNDSGNEETQESDGDSNDEVFCPHLTSTTSLPSPCSTTTKSPKKISEKRSSSLSSIRMCLDTKQDCAICWEPFKVKEKVCWSKSKSGCRHGFHLDCMMVWLQNQDKCPLCRSVYYWPDGELLEKVE